MKKIILISILLFAIRSSHATSILHDGDPLASDFMVPLHGTNKMISLTDYSNLTIKNYEVLMGRKASFKERFKLKTSQFVAKKMIRKDGTLTTVKLKRNLFSSGWHWHWGGFALGFLLLLGPIIALFFHDEYKWDRFWTAFTTMSILVTLATILVFVAIGGMGR